MEGLAALSAGEGRNHRSIFVPVTAPCLHQLRKVCSKERKWSQEQLLPRRGDGKSSG